MDTDFAPPSLYRSEAFVEDLEGCIPSPATPATSRRPWLLVLLPAALVLATGAAKLLSMID